MGVAYLFYFTNFFRCLLKKQRNEHFEIPTVSMVVMLELFRYHVGTFPILMVSMVVMWELFQYHVGTFPIPMVSMVVMWEFFLIQCGNISVSYGNYLTL